MIKTAMIMAAGMGTRFGRYMELVPKGFVEVGGEAMIVRSVRTLLDSASDVLSLGRATAKKRMKPCSRRIRRSKVVTVPVMRKRTACTRCITPVG